MKTLLRIQTAATAAMLFGICFAFAQTRPLNDTGITFCGSATTGNNSPCLGTEPSGQDRHYGRDAEALAGILAKIGGSSGVNGFDFTKIANNGIALPASAELGTNATDWACTRDNVTGLIWEVKTVSGLRSTSHTYSWYMSASPDGNNGVSSGGTCAAAGHCDTEKYVTDVNAVALCGFVDWRMPTAKELQNLADFGKTGKGLDEMFFPNQASIGQLYWSGDRYAQSSCCAWATSGSGTIGYVGRDRSDLAILVVRGAR